MEPPSLPPENSESAPTTNKMAIASLTLIIIAFVAAFFACVFLFSGTWVPVSLARTAILTPFISIICGLICGHIARRQIRNAEGRERGEGMALAGLILGYCPILILLTFLIVLIIFAAVLYYGLTS